MAWSRSLEPGIIQTQSYWSVLGFLCEMLPTAEQAVSLNLKGNEAYSIKVSVNPSLITFEPDGQLKKKKEMTRRLKSLQPEVPKSFQKKKQIHKKEEPNIAYPVEKTSELKPPVAFGLPGSPSAVVQGISIPVHPGNQHPHSPGSATIHTFCCLAHGRNCGKSGGRGEKT